MNKNTVLKLMYWICSDQKDIRHYTLFTIPQQEVKAMKIVIPSFITEDNNSFTGLYKKS